MYMYNFVNHSDEESRRQAECKLRSEMMEGELEQWREELDAYNRRSMTRAKESAQVNNYHTYMYIHLATKLTLTL